MSTPAPLYFIGPPGPVREACTAVAVEAQTFEHVSAFGSTDEKQPGLVVITEGDESSAAGLARMLWEAGPGWTLVVAGGNEEVEFRTVSMGIPADASALAAHVQAEAGYRTALVDFREAIVQMSRTRHDVNNPLTAALAEIQILLMDVADGTELQESLVIVQEQLRRIRDLVAETGHLRIPRR